MIGRTTLLWLALAALVGFGLFHVKYQVAALEEELTRLNAATLREQTQIHVLEAEWSYLNRPARLEELAERHLALRPLDPAQLGTVAALPLRPADRDLEEGARIAKLAPPPKPPVPAAKGPRKAAPVEPARPAMSAAAPRSAQPPPAPVTPASLPHETAPAPHAPAGLAEARR